mmetsp:Transcript_10448/g.34559  ORF Transcript_10448/g.34559 Transcript_10448/m.34559 type:complete len:208 (+) Transcript_10448:290-913(+)
MISLESSVALASTCAADSALAASSFAIAAAICLSTSALALALAAAMSASIFDFVAATSAATPARALEMSFSFSEMRSATAEELSPTAASWSRISWSRSSSAFPTGPKMVLSRITMSRRNSVAMMGRVRLKSKILPGSPAMEGATSSAFVTAAMSAGLTALGSATLPNLATGATTAARARVVLRFAGTFAPARKRHWAQEIADIVAGL